MRAVKKKNIAFGIQMNVVREVVTIPLGEWRGDKCYRGWELKFHYIVYLHPSLCFCSTLLWHDGNNRNLGGGV